MCYESNAFSTISFILQCEKLHFLRSSILNTFEECNWSILTIIERGKRCIYVFEFNFVQSTHNLKELPFFYKDKRWWEISIVFLYYPFFKWLENLLLDKIFFFWRYFGTLSLGCLGQMLTYVKCYILHIPSFIFHFIKNSFNYIGILRERYIIIVSHVF